MTIVIGEHDDAVSVGAFIVTKGTTVLLAFDFSERNSRTFDVSGAVLSIFNPDTFAIYPLIDHITGGVGTTPDGSPRVQFNLFPDQTDIMVVGTSIGLMSFALTNGESRQFRVAIRVREVVSS